MYFYFFSEYPAAVKLQGIYYGKIDRSVKFCRLSYPLPLVEICPLTDAGNYYTFFPDEKFLSAPPEYLSVTDLKGGYMLRFSASAKKDGFKILAQEKFSELSLTVFSDNGYKLSVETVNGSYIEELDFKPLSVTASMGVTGNAGLLFCEFLTEKGKILQVYKTADVTLLLKKEYVEFTVFEDGFALTEKLFDIAKHKIVYYFTFDGKSVAENRAKREVTADGNFCPEDLVAGVIPYAFCEEFSVGGDYGYYLSDEIKENADKLGEYLGNFIGVTTPPAFKEQDRVGLVYKKGERTYSVEYFLFDLEGGKIVNVKKVD